MSIVEMIIQLLGYYLQTFPILFILLVVVPDRCWRKSASRTYMRLSVANGVLGLLFTAVLYIFSRNIMEADLLQLIADSMMFISILTMFIYYTISIDLNIIVKLLLFVMDLHYAAIVIGMNTFICNHYLKNLEFWSGIESVFPYRPWTLVGIIYIYIWTIPFVCGFMKKKVCPMVSVMEDGTVVRTLVLMVIVTSVYCVCATVFNATEIGMEGYIFLLGLIIGDVVVYYFFFSEMYYLKHQEEVRQQERLGQIQYQRLVRNIEETRRMQHDIRHHLNILSVLLKDKRYEELSAYLKENQTIYDGLETKVYSENLIVDSVLNYYVSKMQTLGIEAVLKIGIRDIAIDKTDLVVILGNALENAVEACKEVDDHPKIEIKMAIVRQMLLIQVENTCVDRGDSSREFADYREFPSTKGGGEGLKSIHAATLKYGGSALFRQSDGCFTARIMLKNEN